MFWGETQTGHDRHVLDFEFVAVVRTLAVIEVELKREALLFGILGTDVLFFVRARGARAFARVVDPTHEVVVAVFFTDASEICSKSSALDLIAFADGMAGEAAARFEKLFSVSSVAGLVLGQWIGERRLPNVGGDGLNLIVFEAEIRHLGSGAEVARFLGPNRNPVLV